MDCLFVSNLFPNPVEPGKGAYNRDQLVALTKLGLKVQVLSPVPWFPLLNPWKRGIPHEAVIEGIPVTYCRQLYLPGSRGSQNGWLYSWSIRRQLSRLIREHQPRFLWSSFAYPDGVGVAQEAKRHSLPHVVSLLGSDINLNRQYPARWRVIMESLKDAALIFAKSKALRDAVQEGQTTKHAKYTKRERRAASRRTFRVFSVFRSLLSCDHSALPSSLPPIHIDYNGVDQELFCPADHVEACRKLGIDPAVRRILFVGNLVPVKDVATLIRAFALLVGEGTTKHAKYTKRGEGGAIYELVIVGSGSEEPRLRKLASDHGLIVASDTHTPTHPHTHTLSLPGRLPRKEVSQWMQACDIFCLPSLNEGVPNVVLEALACGTPVVASQVGGIAEVHPGSQAGALVEPGDVSGFATALGDALGREWDSEALRASVESFTWDENARKVMEALRDV